jgi:class 3 adenylate cyclase
MTIRSQCKIELVRSSLNQGARSFPNQRKKCQMQGADPKKSPKSKHWLSSYSLSGWSAFTVALICAGIFLLSSRVEIGAYLNSKIADPLNFKIRDMVGRTQELDPRIKVFVFDDKSFSQYGAGIVSFDTWAEIFEAVASKQPKVIVIDGMFSDSSAGISQAAQKSLKKMQQFGVPIVTGSFALNRELDHRFKWETTGAQYAAVSYVDPRLAGRDAQLQVSQMPSWADRSGWVLYGPSKLYQNIFSHVGHIQLFAENKVEPFLRLGDEVVVPHATLYTADSITFFEKSLVVNGQRVALGANGETPVNFVHPKNIFKRPMMKLIDKSTRSKALENIDAGDVVVFLPLYFTGNVDLRPTAYGFIPGGVYIVSMINSVISGKWLQPVLVEEALIIIFISIFVLAAFYLNSQHYLLFFAGTTATYFFVVQAMFSYGGLVVPYLLPLAAGNISGALIFLMSRQKEEHKSIALHSALDGAVSPGQLAEVLRSPEKANLDTRERIVTVMFIDIVGFSMSTEAMVPRVAFDCLKDILGKMASIVHRHGGIVDKTLGDGLLCYFGYRFDSDITTSQHSEMAVRCGIEIQQVMLLENVIAARTFAPMYPLRIGINTASCYLGNLGSGSRVEFTVVGNGVNFAKRLEASCETNSIMIGPTTADLLHGISFGDAVMGAKNIQIKHFSEPVKVWEINPFSNRKAETDEVAMALASRDQYRRANGRIVVSDYENLIVTTSDGSASILNFSSTGINVLYDRPRAISKVLILNFESRVPGLAEALRANNITDVEANVCWTYPSGSSFAHGLKFINLSESQQAIFLKILTEYAFLTRPVQKVSGI